MAVPPAFATARTLAVAALCGLLGAGCRGPNLEFDCDYQSERFQSEVDQEGVLLPDIPQDEPFPVALALSETGLQRIIDAAVGMDIPFTGDLPLAGLTAGFEPMGMPRVVLEDVPGCVDCIFLDVDFFVSLTDANGSLSTGTGTTRLGIPLHLVPSDGSDAVGLYANYPELRIESLEFTVYGFDSQEHDALAGAMRILLEEKLREIYGDTLLLTLQPWMLGSDSVRLRAEKLFIFPQDKLLSVAMHTNLALPPGAGLERPSLPDGVHLGVRMDSGLFQAVAERMMVEDVIPRRYNEDGEPDGEGNFGVTIQSLVASTEPSEDMFDVTFRVWRTSGGSCGFAEILMPMTAAWVGRALQVSPGPINVLFGKGSGELAEEDDQVVDENQALLDTFKNSLAEQIALTMGLDAIDLAGQDIVVETPALHIRPDAVALDMDFFIVQEP